jgi:single-strand DNA-binding protein
VASSFNRVILMGNLTRSPELKHLQSGVAVLEAGLAINEKYKDKSGNYVDDVVFVDVTLWGRSAEVCAEYCDKGSAVMIEGRLKLQQWEKDGQKRSKLSVTGESLKLLGSKGDRGTPRQSDPGPARDPAPTEVEIPFAPNTL